MYLRYWILLAVSLAVTYAATETSTSKDLQEKKADQELVRQKRFLLTSALLAGKTLLSAGAFGLGLTSGALIGGHAEPGYVYHPYPVYRRVYAIPYHGWY